jgi:hypothetical protein
VSANKEYHQKSSEMNILGLAKFLMMSIFMDEDDTWIGILSAKALLFDPLFKPFFKVL